MNFASFGVNFQPPAHQHPQMLNTKLNQNHENSIHYQSSPGENVSSDMVKYPCVTSMNCAEQSEVKYVLAQSSHHQYIETPQTSIARSYIQVTEQHHEQGEGSKNIIQRTENRGTMTVTTPWQGLVTPGVADYLARLPASALPLSLHHFLKFSTDNSRDVNAIVTPTVTIPSSSPNSGKKKPAKKSPKPYRPKVPRPKTTEIRLTTGLDGTTLYCCPECHMAYPEKESLERHIVSHRMERRFVCDICGAGLKRKDHLTRHKQSHNPERPYVCSICLKAFKRKEHLNLHFIMHSGEKTHVCSECGKGFYCKDHLDRHKQGHNPERPFICTICLKGFKRNEHLARHCIIHSGEKSQVCPECGKGFYRKDHLRKHLRSHVAKRVKTEQGSSSQQQQQQHAPTVASLAAMVSMGAAAALPGVLAQDGSSIPLLSTPV
ncbi:hypothetical protein B566_EDAN012765 [Ephemera danica]|nr:hypothetical protein B566_EDAN012765 [Ephemera danica]